MGFKSGREIMFISKICHFIVKQAELYRRSQKNKELQKYGIDFNNIGKVEIFHIENVKIGKGSYFNEGQIHAGPNSKISIGEDCAIGYNVHIKAFTHSINKPTGENIEVIEKDIIIGNNVWIGDNVYIREGIKIGNNVIIGANSVVTKDIESNTVVAGCPAKKIYMLPITP
ncbi:MAG: acyltransferase [Bacteroidetes bacterium]|nr:acyltransferase [Bacteroidota bacterium]